MCIFCLFVKGMVLLIWICNCLCWCFCVRIWSYNFDRRSIFVWVEAVLSVGVCLCWKVFGKESLLVNMLVNLWFRMKLNVEEWCMMLIIVCICLILIANGASTFNIEGINCVLLIIWRIWIVCFVFLWWMVIIDWCWY